MNWLYLALAIVSEVIATSALKSVAGFTRLIPTALVVVGYGSSFYFLSATLKVIPIGVAYAIWSGVGLALICAVGWFVYHQTLDRAALAGISLIAAGVVVLMVFSKSSAL